MKLVISKYNSVASFSNGQPDSHVCFIKEDMLVVKTPGYTDRKQVYRRAEYQLYRIAAIHTFGVLLTLDVDPIGGFHSVKTEHPNLSDKTIERCKNWIEDHEHAKDAFGDPLYIV